MIEMNRVSRLLHKDKFSPLKRRMIAYFKRYRITAQDIIDKSNEEEIALNEPEENAGIA